MMKRKTISEFEEPYTVDFKKCYMKANEILASSEAITGFPVDVKALITEQHLFGIGG